MRNQALDLTLCLCAAIPLGCEERTRYTDAKSPYYTRANYSYDQRGEFRLEMQKASEKIEKRVADLKEDIEAGKHSAKDETRKSVIELENGLASLKKELSNIDSAARENWDSVRQKIANTVDDLGRRVDRALAS